MKKIFTLVLSLGLLTSAFAQSGHRQQNQNPANTYQSSSYSGNSRYSRNSTNSYSTDKNSQWKDQNGPDQHDQYAYTRNYRDRDGNFRDRDEHYSPKYGNERTGHNYDEYPQPVKIAPLLQIIIGIGLGRR